MKRLKRLIPTVFLSGILLAGAGIFLQASDPKPEDKAPQKSETKASESTAQASGYIVQLDETRGTIKDNPELSPEMKEALSRLISTSSEGLIPITTESGAVVVDLQGRFRSATVATLSPDGKVQTQCISVPPEKAKETK